MAGILLTRDFLMEAMDLATIIAAEDSDLLELFTTTGRMPQLVDALASASKQLLISTSSKKGTATQSKKMRAKGWTHELWNVKA
jgi:nuclear pore complex protein Nup107